MCVGVCVGGVSAPLSGIKLLYGKEWYASLTVVYSLFIFLKYLKLDFKEKNQKYASKLAILIIVNIVKYLY